MNKIKVVSQIGFQTMKSQSNEYYVPQNNRNEQKVFFKRPLTPKQIFKYVQKESQIAHSRFKKVERIKTQSFQQFEHSKDGQYWYQDQGPTFQKKNSKHNFMRQRPLTSKTYQKLRRDKKARFQGKEDISQLKNDIGIVLAKIKQEQQLTKIRMDRKYNVYSNKKFGKYWNPRINLLAQTGENFNKKTIS